MPWAVSDQYPRGPLTVRLPVTVSTAVSPHRTRLASLQGQRPLQAVQSAFGARQGSGSLAWAIVTCKSKRDRSRRQSRHPPLGEKHNARSSRIINFPSDNGWHGGGQRSIRRRGASLKTLLPFHGLSTFTFGAADGLRRGNVSAGRARWARDAPAGAKHGAECARRAGDLQARAFGALEASRAPVAMDPVAGTRSGVPLEANVSVDKRSVKCLLKPPALHSSGRLVGWTVYAPPYL